MEQASDVLLPVREAFAIVAAIDVNQETLRRWTRRGIRGIRLNCWKVANTYLSTPAAVREFIEKTNANKDPAA